jgi:GNAT superfamily N-acetyltransferase
MVVRGKIVDMTTVHGFAIYENENIIGLITYLVKDNECEIMSLDSLKEKQGIGTSLVNKVIETAAKEKWTKIKLIATNDNINAIGFYQKRGFDMVRLYHNALDVSRKVKPSIPVLGDFNIPLRHEIEFEMKVEEYVYNES